MLYTGTCLLCTGVEDQDTFNLEMKGFLQELQCPYSSLTSNIGALNKDDNRMLLLSYLLSELQVSRLLKEEDKQAVVKVILSKNC